MDVYSKINQRIKRISGEQSEIFYVGKVKSVEGDTCTVEMEGLLLSDCRLRAVINGELSKILIRPKAGSYVMLASLGSDLRSMAVTGYSEIDAVELKIENSELRIDKDGFVFNGGTLDGMVKIKELTEKLNGLKDAVNSLVSTFNSHIHTTTATIGTGGPGVIAPTTTTAQNAQAFNKSDYENEKVKQ